MTKCVVCVCQLCATLVFYKSYSVNIKMNILYDLYLACQGRRNIFQEVKEFQKQEFQSRNFQAVMEWLKLSDLVCKNKVTSNLTMKTEK